MPLIGFVLLAFHCYANNPVQDPCLTNLPCNLIHPNRGALYLKPLFWPLLKTLQVLNSPGKNKVVPMYQAP